MLAYVLLGMGLAFTAAIQPGPLQAFLFSRVAAHGWRRTLPAALAPLISDVPIASLALFVFGQLPVMGQDLLRVAGGILLIFLAWSALRMSSRPSESDIGSAPRTLFQAALVNVLNPNPYLAWALVMGPAVAAAWHVDPAYSVALVVAFYGTMVTTLAVLIFLFGTARHFGAKTRRALLVASALVLASIGAYQLVTSALRLFAG